MVRTLINGMESNCLAVTDRGLHYGDGLFETVAIRAGGLCLWREHFARLSRGANLLDISCPPEDLLLRECRQLIDGTSIAVLKIVLTRGSGGRGYLPPDPSNPRRILSLHPWPDHPAAWRSQGVALTLCRTPVSENRVLAGLKHLNRLEQVLARSEWRDPEIAEGLMQNSSAWVIGGTMSNLFLVREGRLTTPRLDRCGIAGTVRDLVLRLAGYFGIDAAESDINLTDLATADGLFITNALIGVWPVRRLGARTKSLECLPAALIAAVRKAAWNPEEGRRD
jgi:4-amino-4-deoxychorismate lyase